MILWLIVQGYAVFSDDGAVRLSLADEWAASPYVVAQIPWLPLQYYIVGCLIKLTGLSSYILALTLNIFCTLALPWMFALCLPERFKSKQKAICLWLIGIWPWALWLGVSGLTEPLMWLFALGLYANYKSRNRKYFIFFAILLSMCRIEAWLWVGLLGLSYLYHDFKAKRYIELIVTLLCLCAFPLFWVGYQYFEGQLGLSASMRQEHAEKDYGSAVKPLLFWIVAFFTAPFWLLFAKSFVKNFKNLKQQPLVCLFVIIFYATTILVGLATAVPQRNLVLPLMLLLPSLIEHSRHSWKAVLLLQLLVVFHPQELLRADTCTQRHEVAALIQKYKGHLNEGENIMLCLEDDPHRYLGNHLAHLTTMGSVLLTDTQPHHYSIETWPNGGKYIIYEHFKRIEEPLTNYWRSYKKKESLFEKRLPRDVKKILKVNKVKLAITGRKQRPLHFYGYELLEEKDPFAIYIKKSEQPLVEKKREVSQRPASRKQAMIRLLKGQVNKEGLSTFLEMMGL